MIHTYSLRLGNIVYSTTLKQSVRISELTATGAKVKSKTGLGAEHYVNDEDLQPVKLDDKCLRSLGFKYSDEHRAQINDLLVLVPTPEGFEVYFPTRMRKIIKHAHELQNIYYTLFDRELPITIEITTPAEVEAMSKL
jgi:hypothetical protein